MKKKHKIYLIISLILITGLSLFFSVINSSIPSEINILWKNYFPEPPEKRYYQKIYLEKAILLKKKGDYIGAIKILKEGLKKVKNKDLEGDVINVHKKIIHLFLRAKRVNLALKEMDCLMNLLNRRDIDVSKDAIYISHNIIMNACKEIKNTKLCTNYYQQIIDYRRKMLKNAIIKPLFLGETLLRFEALVFILKQSGKLREAIKTAKDAIKYNEKNAKTNDDICMFGYLVLSQIYAENGDYFLAIKTLERFLKFSKTPRDRMELHIEIAKIYTKSNNFKATVRELKKAELIIPQIISIYKNQNYLFFQDIAKEYKNIGEYKKAIKLLKKVLAYTKAPSDIKAINNDINQLKEKMTTKKTILFY